MQHTSYVCSWSADCNEAHAHEEEERAQFGRCMNLTCYVTVHADIVLGRIWCEDSLIMAAHGLQQL